MWVMSPVFYFEREAREALEHRPVERGFVFLGRVGFDRGRIPVAEVGEQLGARLDEVHVVTVSLLRLVAVGPVVRALRGLAVGDQARVLALEEVELARDDIGEALAGHYSSSR